MYPDLVTLNIPIDSYLKKYLVKKYGTQHTISKDSWLGRYFIEILDHRYRKQNISLKKNETYPIVVPYYIIKDVGFDLPTSKMKAVVEMIEKIFYNDLYTYVEVSVDSDLKFMNDKSRNLNQQNVYKAMCQFLAFYDISEMDLNVESIYKRYYRDRVSDKKKKGKKQVA